MSNLKYNKMKKNIKCFLIVGDDMSYIVRCTYLNKFLEKEFPNGLTCERIERITAYESNTFKFYVVFHKTGDIVTHD